MKTRLCILFLLTSLAAFAQADTVPVYKRFPVIPPFSLVKLPDSSSFTKQDLKKKKPVLIMIFSPDCDHCQQATRDLLQHHDLFKTVQVILVSSLDYKAIHHFYEEYHIGRYPNIIMARDPAYFLSTFYKVSNFPSLYLYDKKGKFIQGFTGDISFERIATLL